MPEKTKKAKSISVMDVSKPGKSAPPTSSRPLIIGHQPLLKDPMLNQPTAPPVAKEPTEPVDTAPPANTMESLVHTTKPRITITPPTLTKKSAEEAQAKTEAEPKAPDEKPVENPTQPPETPASESPAAGSEAPEPTNDNAQVVDEFAAQAVTKKEQAVHDKAAAERKERVGKLIADKTYVLPIGQVRRKRNMRWILLLLLLVLVAAGVNFAIDAGLIKTSVQPLTNIFP